jgi:hypothetical protein
VVVENVTGSPSETRPCGGLFQVGLGNATVKQTAAWPTCMGPVVTIPTGRSSYPAGISASYTECTPSEPPNPGQPVCLMDPFGMPPLPPGKYLATVESEFPSAISIPTIPIRVTPG